ncbi:asparaginase [bacterium]|nr:asparaginase [bacterium]
MSEIIAKVIRNDRVESVHRGHFAVVNHSGRLVASLGRPNMSTYIRSAAKPFQAMPLIEDGVDQHYGFNNKEIAVTMASHNGEPFHIAAVQNILNKIGLTDQHLGCGFHPPMSQLAAAERIKEGASESAIYNNCSGKHSGMLALAKYHNWPLSSYLDFEHQAQKRIKATVGFFAKLNGEAIGVGVDGCSAPVYYLPLKNMALMYARLAQGSSSAAERVFDIMSGSPEMIAGTSRFDTELMRVMKGKVVSKIGAEGIRCLGVRGEKPLGIALKIEDGSRRASQAAVLEIMRQLDLITHQELRALESFQTPILHNHAGIETGTIAVEFDLKL